MFVVPLASPVIFQSGWHDVVVVCCASIPAPLSNFWLHTVEVVLVVLLAQVLCFPLALPFPRALM
jgi:hypothetical protein